MNPRTFALTYLPDPFISWGDTGLAIWEELFEASAFELMLAVGKDVGLGQLRGAAPPVLAGIAGFDLSTTKTKPNHQENHAQSRMEGSGQGGGQA